MHIYIYNRATGFGDTSRKHGPPCRTPILLELPGLCPRQVPVPSSTLGTWKWSPTPRMLSLMNNIKKTEKSQIRKIPKNQNPTCVLP